MKSHYTKIWTSDTYLALVCRWQEMCLGVGFEGSGLPALETSHHCQDQPPWKLNKLKVGLDWDYVTAQRSPWPPISSQPDPSLRGCGLLAPRGLYYPALASCHQAKACQEWQWLGLSPQNRATSAPHHMIHLMKHQHNVFSRNIKQGFHLISHFNTAAGRHGPSLGSNYFLHRFQFVKVFFSCFVLLKGKSASVRQWWRLDFKDRSNVGFAFLAGEERRRRRGTGACVRDIRGWSQICFFPKSAVCLTLIRLHHSHPLRRWTWLLPESIAHYACWFYMAEILLGIHNYTHTLTHTTSPIV